MDFDLLEQALAVGAIDFWTEDGGYYVFHAGSRTFRVTRVDGTGFLTALINRRHMELLRARRSTAPDARYTATKMLSSNAARGVVVNDGEANM